MDLPQLAYRKYGAGSGALRETVAVTVSVHLPNLWELSEAAGGPRAGCVRQRRHRLWGAVWPTGRTICHSYLGEYSIACRDLLKDGSAGSIGYGIAIAYAKEGANLVITGRNVKKLEEAKEELERLYNIKVLCIQADVSKNNNNEEIVKNVVDQTIKEFGRIDVLINNAQASASGVTLVDHSLDQFDLAIYSGLYATYYYMKLCYPYLKETKGTVINFASGAGLFGNFGQCAYAAAKEGIRGLSRVAATEWGKDGINVNVICPLAWTAQLENFQKAYPDAFKANVKMPPLGHYGDAELEIGRVCVQLASPDFKYMSGETITLEGGMGLRP